MVVERGPTQEVLVVVLSARALPEAFHRLTELPAVRLAPTDDCYQAAADLLIAPEALLVVDAATLRPDQLGLLTLARRMDTPVYLLGQPPRPLPELAGMPVIAPEQLPELAQQALAADLPATAQSAAPDQLDQAEQAEEERALETPVAPKAERAEPEQPMPEPGRPAELLSPEEIAALLEGRM